MRYGSKYPCIKLHGAGIVQPHHVSARACLATRYLWVSETHSKHTWADCVIDCKLTCLVCWEQMGGAEGVSKAEAYNITLSPADGLMMHCIPRAKGTRT